MSRPFPSRILAIRLGALGDVLLTIPALALAARTWPASRLDVLTRAPFAPLVSGHPAVTRVLTPEPDSRGGLAADLALARRVRRERYDLVLDLHGTPRSRLVSALSGAADRRRVDGARLARRRLVWAAGWRRRLGRARPATLAAIEPVALRAARLIDPTLDAAALRELATPIEPPTPGAADGTRLGALLARLPVPRVALLPGARHATKCWSEEGYVELAARLAAAGCGVLVGLGPQDRAPALEAAARAPGAEGDRTSLRVVRGDLSLIATMLAGAAAAVGNDSGLTHLAVAVGVPAVVLFGATVPELGFAPPGRHRIVERLDVGCRPCSVHGGARCPRGDHACMRGLEVELVLASLAPLVPDLLERGPRTVRVGPEAAGSGETRAGRIGSGDEHGRA